MANLKSTEITETGFLQLPRGTTSERPASPSAGEIRFNTDTKICEWYDDQLGAWFPTGTVPPVATGGDTVEDIDIDGLTYRIHSFTTVGENTFIITRSGQVDFLIVAGGASGGSYGGGGGAGGLLTGQKKLKSGIFTVAVGAGGPGISTNSTSGINGQNSSALGVTAIGGGGGGNNDTSTADHSGLPGGSGGGASNQNVSSGNGGPGTPGQGNSGGANTGGGNSGFRKSRGGGGAGQPADSGNGSELGNGGNGLALYLTDSVNMYAGGGGGHNWDNTDRAEGGIGGGGRGGSSNSGPENGQLNTGSGGGGSEYNDTTGSGGSGVVIICYRIS